MRSRRCSLAHSICTQSLRESVVRSERSGARPRRKRRLAVHSLLPLLSSLCTALFTDLPRERWDVFVSPESLRGELHHFVASGGACIRCWPVVSTSLPFFCIIQTLKAVGVANAGKLHSGRNNKTKQGQCRILLCLDHEFRPHHGRTGGRSDRGSLPSDDGRAEDRLLPGDVPLPVH